MGRIGQWLVVEGVNKEHEQSLKAVHPGKREHRDAVLWEEKRQKIRFCLRSVLVCFRFWVRKGGWRVGLIWAYLRVWLSQPHVVLFAWRHPISFVHKKNVNVRVQFASHVPLLDMFMLFRTRSLLGPVHNCQHGEVVGLAILISAKTGALFQNRL